MSRKQQQVQKQVESESEPITPLRKLRKCKVNPYKPKNKSQIEFINTVEENDIIFLIGAAGTGKSLISVSWALESLLKRKFKKIVLTRPAIEACGERIGFLPGIAEEKLAPYMMPVYDILGDYNLTRDEIYNLIELGIIEICPLGFLRGRSFKDSVVIVEESQNVSVDQMKMILTRLGDRSKLIFTGDTSQRDMKQAVGIEDARKLISDLPTVKFIDFTSDEVLRSGIVKDILKKYEDRE